MHSASPKTKLLYLMDQLYRFEPAFHRVADCIFAYLPQPFPGHERLNRCKIIAHRGVFDNLDVLENTLPAFETAKSHDVWGIEFDIRWTRDHCPVVIHDSDLQRVFNAPEQLSDLTFARLRSRFPLIPSLEEVVSIYGKHLHLMIEIKAQHYPDPISQNRLLAEVLSPLTPGADYHLLSLNPDTFETLTFAPTKTFLPVATLQTRRFSDLALTGRYGGITGHYLFLTNRLIRRHRKLLQHAGTGFIASRNCLYREVNRGVEWIFSNHAAKLQTFCNPVLKGG